MARRPRYRLPGVAQYVLSRGHNGNPVFTDRHHYLTFRDVVEECAIETGCDVHAYAFVPSEVHLLMTPWVMDGIPKFVQSVGRIYGRYFNKCQQRRGTLWDGRYRASLIEPGLSTLMVQAYIEHVPFEKHGGSVSVGLSSRMATSCKRADSMLREHSGNAALEGCHRKRRERYEQFAREGLSQHSKDDIENCLEHGLVYGSEAFKDEMTQRLGVPVRLGRPGRPRKGDGTHQSIASDTSRDGPRLVPA